MADPAHNQTNKLIANMEKRVAAEYKQASREAEAKLADYTRRFEAKDAIWQERLKRKEVTVGDYAQWLQGQVMMQQRWEEMRDSLAADYHNANKIARSIVNGYMPEVYALNHNYATFQVEKSGHVDTSYTLYSRETIERILRDEPELLPPPGPQMKRTFEQWDAYKRGDLSGIDPELLKSFGSLEAAGKDLRWQQGKIQSVMLQSILQGESIPNISKRVAETMGEINHKSTIRYARTAITAAQNAGRQDAYHRAEAKGVEMEREWVATLDTRTRHEHRQLNGQTRGIDEPFEVDGYELMYPGDPSAPAKLIWCCRCTLAGNVKGWESKTGELRDYSDIGDMSYSEWQAERKSESHRITKQEDIAETMRRRYIKELYNPNGPVGPNKDWRDEIDKNYNPPDTRTEEQKHAGEDPTKAQADEPKKPTIAGVEQGKPMSHAEADTGNVNPHYGESEAYGINCQSCVVTYEARLRGFDVEVVPNDKEHEFCEKVAKDICLPWKDKDGNKATFSIGGQEWIAKSEWEGLAPTAKRFEKQLNATVEEGGRYFMVFGWKGSGSGHVVTVKKTDGVLEVYDPQANTTMRGKYVSYYLDQFKYRMTRNKEEYYFSPGILRVDDKELDLDIANQIMRKAGK